MELYLGDRIRAPGTVSHGRHFQEVARLLVRCNSGVVRFQSQNHRVQEPVAHQIEFLGPGVLQRQYVEDPVVDCRRLMLQTASDLEIAVVSVTCPSAAHDIPVEGIVT